MNEWTTVSIVKRKGIKIMLVSEDVLLDDVLTTFEDCLKGAGFVFDGHLDFTDEELS